MKRARGTFKYSAKGNTGLLYIPSKVAVDSAFPLKEGTVIIEITDGKLEIRPEKQETKK